jgi:cell division protein FtsI/penicillin-binding protein 2
MRNLRLNLIFFLILFFAAAILGRLFFIQVLQNDFYKALAQGLFSSPNESQTKRGEIFLKDGEPLAINKDFTLVFASPPEILDTEKTAQILSEILHLDSNPPSTLQVKTTYDFILEKLKVDSLYSPIKNKLTQEEIDSLKNLKLAGIYLTKERLRYYPQESLASQVVGFLGAQGSGQYGLEEYYDEILKGKSEGTDLTITIDYDVQFMAEKLLAKAKENLNIEEGQIIVMDPNSGKIIALANFPNFNPNQYQEYATDGFLEIFKNGATQKLFEPGSVFKPITFAAALEEGKITPQTTYVDEGKVQIAGRTIYNYDGRVYGLQTMTNVLEKSINTGAVFVQSQLPHHIFLDYIEKFGIFEPTGIDLPEVYSENEEFKKGYEINFATASFGQGIQMTPIQLARAYCAIANGGKLVTPHLVENYVDVRRQQSRQQYQIISSKTASQLTAMLVSVVENGFGKAAKIPGYYIAGKTGTAQVAEGGKYSTEKTIQTFIGFFPAFNPQFLILVKLNNPRAKTAEYSAAPIFHDLAEYIIHYYQIPPDYE